MEGFLKYEYVREVESKTKYVGRGRGSKKREKKVEEIIRYQITKVTRIKKSNRCGEEEVWLEGLCYRCVKGATWIY